MLTLTLDLALWNFWSFCAYKKKSLFENSNRAWVTLYHPIPQIVLILSLVLFWTYNPIKIKRYRGTDLSWVRRLCLTFTKKKTIHRLRSYDDRFSLFPLGAVKTKIQKFLKFFEFWKYRPYHALRNSVVHNLLNTWHNRNNNKTQINKNHSKQAKQ